MELEAWLSGMWEGSGSPSMRASWKKLAKPCPLEFLWQIHHTVMTDEVIGHWLTHPPAPLPFPEWGPG